MSALSIPDRHRQSGGVLRQERLCPHLIAGDDRGRQQELHPDDVFGRLAIVGIEHEPHYPRRGNLVIGKPAAKVFHCAKRIDEFLQRHDTTRDFFGCCCTGADWGSQLRRQCGFHDIAKNAVVLRAVSKSDYARPHDTASQIRLSTRSVRGTACRPTSAAIDRHSRTAAPVQRVERRADVYSNTATLPHPLRRLIKSSSNWFRRLAPVAAVCDGRRSPIQRAGAGRSQFGGSFITTEPE
jgi:hypothetical protein